MKIKILIGILTLFILFISGCGIVNCNFDLNCFKEASKICESARVNIIKEGTNIRATIRGLSGENCLISFKIEEVGEDLKQKYPQEAYIIKDKTLNCAIPRSILEKREKYLEELLNNKDEINKYCSGPIKDIFQNLVIDKII